MIELDLRRELEGAAERLRRSRLWSGLSLVWLAAALVGAVLIGLSRLTGNVAPLAVGLLTVLAAIAALVCVIIVRRSARDYAAVARRIEHRYPNLDARLLTALEQAPAGSTSQLGFLQHTVIREALSHARRHDWEMIVPERKLQLAKLAHAAALIALVVVLGNLLDAVVGKNSLAGSSNPSFARRSAESTIHIEPGDASIERGTGLLVLARFDGQLPPDVHLLYRDASDGSQSLPMSKSLDDPLFAGRIPSVNEELKYSVRYGDQRTRWYKVTVFDYPDLVRADARLEFPDYTGMSQTVIEDTRSVTAVEGTRLTFVMRLNKPVADARLTPSASKEASSDAAGAAPSGTLTLTVDPVEPTTYTASLVLQRSQRYRLHLVDGEGRKNREPPELAVHVIPNRPAEVKLAAPARDVQVSPLEELAIKARVSDDFGLQRFGLAFSMAGEPPEEVVLGEKAPGKERRDVDHLIALESLKAEPDQLLAYYFWAEDAAADGSLRRTSGDMYFAEVRAFEEIYRQGEQPTGEQMQQSAQQQGGRNAQRAEQLAELQKQIINATWKLVRRETAARPTEKFVPDVQLLGESQASAKEQAAALDERLQDPRSKAYLKSVLDRMDRALAELLRAKDGPAINALKPALAAEQAAYQALLKLRAREHEVIRGNRQQRGGGGGGGGNRSQQQLDQLELADSQNRYETQRSAASQQSAQEQAEERETRQVLNRLRELAQRQEDLNRQMKELQAALQEARDQKQQQEIRRQLARLRDEQQQMLRDTDELRDRMDRNENQERMADARQQLDETRTNIRRASEALEEGRLSQAAASGARAGEELNRLRDEFRQANAGQFSDAMNEMREDARQLDEKQQQISERLANVDQTQQRSLRDSGARRATAEELQKQKQDLQKLLDNMRRTIEESEASEPLLSKQLYDTARQARENQPEQALEVGSQLLDRGFLDEARAAERQAGRGIGELRKGVEQAADSVLGGDTEGLRRARAELDALAEQLNREISRARQGSGTPRTDDELAQNQSATPTDRPRPEQEGNRNASQPNADTQPGAQQSQGAQQSDAQQDGPQQDGQQQGNAKQEGAQNQGQRGGAQQGGDQQRGAQSADQQSGGQQAGDAQQSGQQQAGQQGAGQRGSQQGGLRQDGPRNSSRREGGTTGPGGNADLDRFLGGTTGPAPSAENPLTGEGFREWTDRLRDVEEMVGDPRLRAEAARIRDRATGMRAEFKRHSKEPNWELVQEFIGRPLVELRAAVAEELQRRDPSGALVPIDREPVPPEYAEPVRRYYERLGSGR